MESLKEKFNITKNSLFDWSIIEKKTKLDEAPKDTKINTDSTLLANNVSLETQENQVIKETKETQENYHEDSIIKIEITDIKNDDKLNIHKLLYKKNNSIKPKNSNNNVSIDNKVELNTIAELNANLSNLIDKISNMTTTIEILEEKINSLEEISNTNNKNQLVSYPYLGALNYPFYDFYLHHCNFDNDTNTKSDSLDEIK